MTKSGDRSVGRASGFTLVEVIVVLSVVLLLTGIAVPMLTSYMEDARRARAESEMKVIGSAVMSFYKDLGVYPARSAAGADNTLRVLTTGPSAPTSTTWTSSGNWSTWANNATYGDRLDNHLVRNSPQGATGGAYPTTGTVRWRGPYANASPLDPWGRPYLINVISAYYNNATNYKRVWVISAGPNGRVETSSNATATTELTGDDVGFLLLSR